MGLGNSDERREPWDLSACGSRASYEAATGTRGIERFGLWNSVLHANSVRMNKVVK